MSTTHIQPLPNVRGRMSYTELGEGKKRTRNIREKTNRIAAQMGDMGTREDFIRFCSAMRRQSQGTRLNEGYELRVSWSPEELSKDSPEDIQRACEYGYALCKEVAPNAPCWVTVHTDGEGGCVHVHATIANHDLVSGTAIAHGTDHATVKRKNDRLSREMGFTVVGPEPARERTTWAERKGQFGIESFERVLGNRVADARDHASNMEEFLEELKVRGVELTETRKVDEKTGEETVGWSYKSRDPYGKSRRKRRRRASNLADDLTREGIEAYFEAKQRELEAPQQDAPAPEVLPDVPETAEPAEQPSADSALDVYDLDRAYVSEMASDLQKAHIHRSREAGKPFIPLLSVIAITLIFWLADQKKIRLHLTGKPVYNIILGGVTGTIWLGASVGILSILGVVQIEGKNQIAMLWLWLLAAFLNTVMQEMLVRGYLYQMIKSNSNIAAAIIVSTGLFTFAHGGAFEAGILPVLNVITMSLFMTAVLEYTGSLIAPIVIHFLWNGVGAIILGGVSLAEDYPHLFDMTIHGNPILSGGSCKIEGSIIVLFMNLAFLIGFVAAKKRKDRNR